MQKSNKRKYLIGALAVLLVAVVVGGTVAWLTASNSVKNTFTVGEITEPTTPPSGENPDGGDDDNITLTGNIYEIFEQDSKIIPGENVMKRAWIGIGDGSEDSFVFAFVENSMMSDEADAVDQAYFELNTGWKPVGTAGVNYNLYNNEQDKYTGGLFMWVGEAGIANTPVALIGNATADVWTNQPVFDTVEIPQSAVHDDFVAAPVMNVYSFIVAEAKGMDSNAAMNEAKDWATGNGNYTDNKLGEIAGQAATPEP